MRALPKRVRRLTDESGTFRARIHKEPFRVDECIVPKRAMLQHAIVDFGKSASHPIRFSITRTSRRTGAHDVIVAARAGDTIKRMELYFDDVPVYKGDRLSFQLFDYPPQETTFEVDWQGVA